MTMFHNTPIWWNNNSYPSTPANGYITEDSTEFYVAEDGSTYYVQES